MIAMKHSLISSTPKEDAPPLFKYINHSDMNVFSLDRFQARLCLSFLINNRLFTTREVDWVGR